MKKTGPLFRYVFAALTIAVLSIAAVPAARAQAMQTIEEISDIVFISFGPLPQSGEQPTILFMEDGKLRPQEFVTIEEARARAGYPVLVPDWAPDGFMLASDDVSLVSLQNDAVGMNIKWQNGQEVIFLYVAPVEGEFLPLQGDGVTEVTVNGKPAWLMSSSFSVSAVPFENGTPGPDIVIDQMTPIVSLTWIQDGVQYNLSGSLSPEDAMRMAESLK